MNIAAASEPKLSVIITIVSGVEAARKCLQSVYSQIEFSDAEIIVPFDAECERVGELAAEFPSVRFYFIENADAAVAENVSSRKHQLYDRRRAVGLSLARGQITAMTEDHAIPAKDWCEKILAAHAHNQTAAAIGGAIENSVDKPLNRAWYYADFGRYGRPIIACEAEYVSDVNVSYKRAALLEISRSWREAYQETVVHRALKRAGGKLFLDENLVVFQHRPPLKFSAALAERMEWGRVFAETRAAKLNFSLRLVYAAGTIFLPALLIKRMIGNMRRQKVSFLKVIETMPFIVPFAACWSVGESLGYLIGAPETTLNAEASATETRSLDAADQSV